MPTLNKEMKNKTSVFEMQLTTEQRVSQLKCITKPVGGLLQNISRESPTKKQNNMEKRKTTTKKKKNKREGTRRKVRTEETIEVVILYV